MKNFLFCLIVISGFVLIPGKIFGQAVDTGRQSAMAEANFTTLANYELAHPPVFHEMDLENDEDEPHPFRPPVDSSQVRRRATSILSSYIPLSLLPISPAPTDTFNSSLDNGTSIPPDTHGAVDSNYCVTVTNQYVKIHTRAGAVVSKVSLNGFWTSVLPGGGAYDPRVHYDPYQHRWIIITDAGAQSSSSSLLIAVSTTSNPTGGWHMYIVPIAAPTWWLDYPNVGFNQKWVVITGNLFPITGSGYGGCKTYAFNYANLLSGAGAPFTAFTQANSECITPTLTYDATLQNIFAIESWDGTAAGGGQMRLWKISGAVGSETMTSVGYPASTGYNWQMQGNSGNDFAPQLGSANKIQTNDDRVFSSQYINGKIWCTHNVFSPGTGSVTRCSVQWWQLDTFGTPNQIGYVDDPTNANFYSFPSIAVNSSDDALIGFTQFSATTHPNAAYAVHFHTDPVDSTRPIQVYRHGQYTYYKIFSGTRDRWGDYSGTNVDPINMQDFWTVQETCDSSTNNWDTWWAHVSMCNIVATITPSGPTTFCAGNSVTLTGTSGAGYTYQWYNGAATIAGATNMTYSATATGSYKVIITSGCSSTSPATAVSVNPLPAAIGGGSLNVCVGSTTTLTDVSTPGTWSSGTTSVATVIAGTGVVTGSTPGTSVISYTLGTGCATTATVTVNALPTATITPGGATTFCAGNNVTLTASSGAGYTYQWKLGVGAIPGATNVSYVASAGGNYTVVVTDANGCSATSGITAITVNPNPTALTFSSGAGTVCTGLTITVNSTPPGGSWASSDGTVATVSGTGVITGVGTGGIATISYTLGTGCYATSVVTVNSTTPAPITGASTVCVSQTTPLADGTPSGSWSSSATAIATVNSSGVLTGVTAGTATISYVAATTCGTATATLPITVNPTPSAGTISGATAVCVGGTTTLSDGAPSGVWTSNNPAIATVGSSSGVVSGVTTGSTSILYTVTNGFGCSASAVTTLNVFSPFTATATAGGPTNFCSGGSVLLSGTTGAGYSYQWDNGGVAISGATNVNYTATTTGNYSIFETNGSGCNSTSAVIAVSVNPSPMVVPSVNVTASPSFQMCMVPAPIAFTATSSHGGSLPTYEWYVGSALVGGSSTYMYTPAPGDSVTCVLTSNDICASPATVYQSHIVTMLTSFLIPSVSITANKTPGETPGAICAGDSVKFSAVPVNGGPFPTYLWTRNGVNVATGPDYIYVPLNGDHLVCTMTSDASCVSPAIVSSVIFTVTVQNHVTNSVLVTVSQSSITSGSVDTFSAVSINGGSSPTFQWLRNGVVIPGANSAKYITSSLANGDVISCMETSNAACASPLTVISSGIRVLVNNVGVQQLVNVGGDITIMPNPNRGEFNIAGTIGNNGDENVSIVITDMLGQTVYTKAFVARNGGLNENISLSRSIANGMYIVNLVSTDGRSVYHVVVDR